MQEEKIFTSPPTAAELLESMKQTERNDPRSVYYQRVLVRPKLKLWKLPIGLGVGVGLYILLYLFLDSVPGALAGTVGAGVLLCLIFAKKVVITLVKVYQAVAPASLRNRCRYEPSCSAYMILAIEKYGLGKGLKKGFRRWRGCKPPAGGYDMP